MEQLGAKNMTKEMRKEKSRESSTCKSGTQEVKRKTYCSTHTFMAKLVRQTTPHWDMYNNNNNNNNNRNENLATNN